MKNVTILTALLLVLTVGCRSDAGKVPEGDEVILGIFGGMGPEATADLYRQIIEITPAQTDQEHMPTLIFSNPLVPDRMTSIADGGDAIKPYLRFSLRKLEDAGVSFVVIPCNTVHYFYDYMQECVDIPIINMIAATAEEVAEKYPSVRKVGLLATTGTIQSGLYSRELEARGFEVIIPDDSVEINMVMKAVRGIKAGTDGALNEDLLAMAGQHLAGKGAGLIVLGCTEIPLAYNPQRVDLNYSLLSDHRLTNISLLMMMM
ncbi:MAG: amino acid racemase [Bacteroidales bacterium]|jgi:aspartate racemase|nr:amino acid racemase [Bacteroidales bacterium]